MSHHSYRPSVLVLLFLPTVPSAAVRGSPHISLLLLLLPTFSFQFEVIGVALPLALFSFHICPLSLRRALQQLEVQVLGVGLASRLPSGLSGGGDRGDSKAKVGT